MLYQFFKWLGITKKGFKNILLGCALMAFVVVNIHIPNKITEGGILGLTLFLKNIFDLNPAIITPIFDISCFLFAFTLFGKPFLKKTAIASMSFAIFYEIFLKLGPIVPSMYNMPLTASIVAGLGIGIGCGLIIRQGGACGGDDALAMIISNKTSLSISKAYFLSDLVVLLFSLVYIPYTRIIYSLITTAISSYVVDKVSLFNTNFSSVKTIKNNKYINV